VSQARSEGPSDPGDIEPEEVQAEEVQAEGARAEGARAEGARAEGEGARAEGAEAEGAGADTSDLRLRPLTARSVILSVLLGSHPPQLPVRALVRTGELFDITEGTTRVALSRLAADGDVVAEQGRYRLSDRLVARQRRLDEGLTPATRPWRRVWEMAILTWGARSTVAQGAPARGALARGTVGVDRSDLVADLGALRLAELRPGVWVRPANLRRPWPPHLDGGVWRLDGQAHGGSGSDRDLAAALWDLDGWATRAESLVGALAAASSPARRFVIAAAMRRHLQADPLLPPSLLPAGWPGRRLRRAYDRYAAEVQVMLRQEGIVGSS
jgi:phenylacetic acid degradation operon negative regulatory protein